MPVVKLTAEQLQRTGKLCQSGTYAKKKEQTYIRKSNRTIQNTVLRKKLLKRRLKTKIVKSKLHLLQTAEKINVPPRAGVNATA